MAQTIVSSPFTDNRMTLAVTHTSHGFDSTDIGKAVRSSGTDGQFIIARANSAANAEVVGVITSIDSVNQYTITTSGFVDVVAAVPTATAGTVYFLAEAADSQLTSTEPTTAGAVSKPVAVVTESNAKMILIHYRGEVITSAVVANAPNDANYLIGTANSGLSAEIVVGTAPGGELGNTWASPTVDSTHSGSAHHAETHTVVSHSDTTITGAELTQLSGISANVTDTNLNALTDSSTTTALHLHAAGSTAEHGASAHTNLTRYIWMPPGPVHTNGVFEPNRIPLIKLPVNVTATVNFGFQVPVDYHSHTASNVIRLVWLTNVSGGNVMYGRFTSYGQGAGESIEGTSEVTSEETMTANANKLITVSNKSDYLDLSGIAAGDFLGVDFRRNGGHSSDTISDDVRVLGMLFTYTATQ